MNADAPSFSGLVCRPAALLPVAMSLAALAIVLVQLGISGPASPPDEGTAAHLWQILMAGQTPILLWFALRVLHKAPRAALRVMAIQAGAALASLAPVFFLHW